MDTVTPAIYLTHINKHPSQIEHILLSTIIETEKKWEGEQEYKGLKTITVLYTL